MFIPFLYELRRRKVPVGTQEAVALAKALALGLHDSSLSGFYEVARALLVHSEAHLDAFDQAFAVAFEGAQDQAIELTRELLEWLKDAAARRELSEEERALLAQLDPDELERLLQARLREQKERHDRGNRWVGTGGTSPFGHGGENPAGIRIGGAGGGRSAIRVAQERRFESYRADLTLDVRQIEVALRKLRAFVREGTDRELDLEGTIDATAKNAGELEVVTRPPRRPATRVLLLMDVGGSMDPYAHLVSRLFSAASKATHFKDLQTYYFHNCVYGRVFKTAQLTSAVDLTTLLADLGPHYKLVLVGDALMAPYELFWRGDVFDGISRQEGIEHLRALARHFEKSAWLNPEPESAWRAPTIRAIGEVFPMFPLTLEGLGEAVQHLVRGKTRTLHA